MSVINVEELLVEISPEAPCGENLEYDGAYGEMERASVGKPEQQFGDTVVPAEDPDWRDLKRKSLNLLSRTKDLRVVAHLARAVLNTDGFPAFAECLSLLRGYVERFWDTVHPQLDPDDNNDPTLRVNTLVSMCDRDTTLRMLLRTPLASSRTVGRFSLFDIDVASGDTPPLPGTEPPATATIEAAFTDMDVELLKAEGAAARQALADVPALEATLTERVGVANAASFKPLVDVLQRIDKVLADQLRRRGVGVVEETAEGGAGEGGPGAGGERGQRLTGEITSREDVLAALDKIFAYYERWEPSSPLPLLLNRARRLINKNFLEILQDLTPDGLPQAQALGGVTEEGNG